MDILVERMHIEFADRQFRNSKYSLRSFARDLGISATAASMILSRKRKPSAENRKKIISRLALPPAYNKNVTQQSPDLALLKEDDQHRMIAEWAHLAALNLMRPGVKPKTLAALAKHLELPVSYMQTVVERLIRVGWVEKRGNFYFRVAQRIHTTEDVSSAAIRQHHREILERAKTSLESIPMEQREFSTLFLMMKPAAMKKAKELMRQFRTDLGALLDPQPEADGASALFVFAHQLFPLQRTAENS